MAVSSTSSTCLMSPLCGAPTLPLKSSKFLGHQDGHGGPINKLAAEKANDADLADACLKTPGWMDR